MSIGTIAEGLRPTTSARMSVGPRYRGLREVELDPDTRHRYPMNFRAASDNGLRSPALWCLKPTRGLFWTNPPAPLDVSIPKQDCWTASRPSAAQHGLHFISHDLRVVRAMSHHVWLCAGGAICRTGCRRGYFHQTQHPYTPSIAYRRYRFKGRHGWNRSTQISLIFIRRPKIYSPVWRVTKILSMRRVHIDNFSASRRQRKYRPFSAADQT